MSNSNPSDVVSENERECEKILVPNSSEERMKRDRFDILNQRLFLVGFECIFNVSFCSFLRQSSGLTNFGVLIV